MFGDDLIWDANTECRLCMGLAGVTHVKDIGKQYLAKIDRDGFMSRL